MKTTRTQESPSRIRLAVEATADEVAPALDRAFRALAGEVKVPGFRKGKVPRQILESRIGKDAIREAALREALPRLVAEAVTSESLAPVAPPSVEVTTYDLGGDLAFDAIVEVRPPIELPDFSTFVVSRPSTRATEQEVDDQVNRLRDRFATLTEVARPARAGDHTQIDLRTTHHDRELAEATTKDLLYEVGSGGFVPELDAELDAKRAGDIVKFNAVLPEGFPEDWAGKEVTVQVLVKEVREKVVPAADDEFAKTASEFDTLDELRGDIERRIEQVKAMQADGEVRARLLEQLVDSIEFEPPISLIEEELAFRVSRFADQLKRAGLTVDQYLQASDQTEEKVEGDLRKQAEGNVRAQMILEELGRREELSASDDEVAEEVRHHAEATGVDQDELREQLERSGRLGVLAGDIIRRKALDFVVERAEIRDEDLAQAAGDEG